MKCGKCGGRNIDVRPNWKEQPTQPSLTLLSIDLILGVLWLSIIDQPNTKLQAINHPT
jgi:hypothetical protein